VRSDGLNKRHTTRSKRQRSIWILPRASWTVRSEIQRTSLEVTWQENGYAYIQSDQTKKRIKASFTKKKQQNTKHFSLFHHPSERRSASAAFFSDLTHCAGAVVGHHRVAAAAPPATTKTPPIQFYFRDLHIHFPYFSNINSEISNNQHNTLDLHF